MKRWMFFAYGVICYLLFLAIYAYFCAFTANVLTPWSIDAPVVGSWQSAVVINLALLAAFGFQHSVMARPAFKRRWTRIVPQPIERSTYLLASFIVLALFMWLHMFFVSSILLGKDAMYAVTMFFKGYYFFGEPYPAIVSGVVAVVSGQGQAVVATGLFRWCS